MYVSDASRWRVRFFFIYKWDTLEEKCAEAFTSRSLCWISVCLLDDWMGWWIKTSENIRAVQSRLVCRPTAAIWFPLWKLLYVDSIMKMIYVGNKTRRKVSDDFRRAEACVGWWITPAKKWLYAKRASARTFKVAYHFHNERQMIKTEFTRRDVGTRDNSLSFFRWSFGCRLTYYGLLNFSSGVLFECRIQDEEMRWCH